MAQKDIYPMFPTPMSKQIMNNRLKITEKAHNILNKKSEVLQMKFRKVGNEIIEIKNLMGKIMRDASYLFAETRYVTGDFSSDILNRVEKYVLQIYIHIV